MNLIKYRLQLYHALLCSIFTWLPGTSQGEEKSNPIEISTPVIEIIADTPESNQGYHQTTWNREDWELTPVSGIDDLLRNSASYGSFRRTSSRVAHPTTQGVQLRNLGGNAASRTLVLLDGIPQNDPFGGWVYWNRYNSMSLQSIKIQPGSQSSRYGSGALGGVIELESRNETGNRYDLEGRGDTQSTGSTAGWMQQSLGSFTLTVDGAFADSRGYHPLKAEQRGPIDQRADSQVAATSLRLDWNDGDEMKWTARFSWFGEERNNGTPLAFNETDAYDVSLSGSGRVGIENLFWKAGWYYKERHFENQFSAVAAGRTSERAALEQFDVPARSSGGFLELSHEFDSGLTARIGTDVKWQYGQTRERFRNLGAGFTRERHASGEQWFYGIHVGIDWPITEDWTLFANLRGDLWQNINGVRHEFAIPTGVTTFHREIDSPVHAIGNARVGFEGQLGGGWILFGSGYTGHRVPTLNELYRPFRVRNDITEANADLEKEFLIGGELGILWTPLERLEFSLTGFLQYLDDPVVNTFVASGPGVDPIVGFIPAGGTGFQRQNLGETETIGFECSTEYQIAPWWNIGAAYTLSNARFTENSPSLYDGNEVPQAPAHRIRATNRWTPLEVLDLLFEMRYDSAQYEDALNSRRLDDALVFGASLLWTPADYLDVLLTFENIFDEEIETAVASNGLVTVGTPFTAGVTLRVRF